MLHLNSTPLQLSVSSYVSDRSPCAVEADMKSKSTFCLVLLAGVLSVTECLPGGAPATACANVAPNPAASGGHGADPQNSTAPYVLTGLPSSGNYTPGMSYTRECPLTDYQTYSVPPSRASCRARLLACARSSFGRTARLPGCPL